MSDEHGKSGTDPAALAPPDEQLSGCAGSTTIIFHRNDA
jgi:hypothetical protein